MKQNTRVPRTPLHDHEKEQRVGWWIAAFVTVIFTMVVLLKDWK